MGHLELQENTFAFFSCILSVLAGSAGSELGVLIPQLAPLTLSVVRDSVGAEIVNDGAEDDGETLARRLKELRSENVIGACSTVPFLNALH